MQDFYFIGGDKRLFFPFPSSTSPHKPMVLHSGPYIPVGRETWPGELLFLQSCNDDGNPRFFASN